MEKVQKTTAAYKKRYRSPQAKEIIVNVRGILCQSGGTERFTVNRDNSLYDEDWD